MIIKLGKLATVDLQGFDVQGKFIFIRVPRSTNKRRLYMIGKHVGDALLKAGAVNAVFMWEEYDIEVLSDEALKKVGLKRIAKRKKKDEAVPPRKE